MRKTTKVTGTKIAQAAKDLNVTSVTIRRYISEFGIETTTDENGIKVLPDAAMSELQEVRRLKEDGNTNPQVLEFLEETRAKGGDVKAEAKPEKEKPRATRISKSPGKTKEKEVAPAADDDDEDEVPQADAEEEDEAPQARQVKRRPAAKKPAREESEEQEPSEETEGEEGERGEGGDPSEEGDSADGRLKHALTCQTCGKSFEHMNPRLRDCLDCYRAKRKERRRGGDRHKNVIQHPLAQQVASKMANQQAQQQDSEKETRPERPERSERPERVERPERAERIERGDRVAPTARPPRRDRDQIQPTAQNVGVTQPIIGGLKTQVRSYRKAIEETRTITGSLKRRLERPDLPEGDRRWLEQIYAYQLILHQGWRHLSEYRSTTAAQKED
ncbi:MAG: MerR family transcriptional regulator [Candidatus Melainabacteria bacterium]|nr:MerR family transcriptional regulator [Candidatus Melainabacteria bacterium]